MTEAAPTYAVPDLHGRFDLLEAALHVLARGPAGTVVFLGDYVDRGPESAAVLARLRAGPTAGWRWVCLKGNHEAMMVLASRDPAGFDHWAANGGEATLASYVGRDAQITADVAWIDTLATMHVDAHRIFVHGGVESERPLDQQHEETLLWKRYRPQDQGGYGARHVVHGHDPDIDGPLRLAGRTALDTLAWRTGRLCIGVFDDRRPGGPIDVIEVRAPQGSDIGSREIVG